MTGVVANNNKAGLTIHASTPAVAQHGGSGHTMPSTTTETEPSPFTAFVIREHAAASATLDKYREGDKVTFKVIGSQYGLGDDQIFIIVDLVST
jgi:hypothetical protein